MRSVGMKIHIVALCALFSAQGFAQAQPNQSSSVLLNANVPRLIRIHGTIRDETGKLLTGNLGITFTLYKDQDGQESVWSETQRVTLDSIGRYSALLGAGTEAGLPLEIFSSGEARWLGVRPDSMPEQARTLFMSVAYALKAADADTLGGKPASAYVLAENLPVVSAQTSSTSAESRTQPATVASSGLTLLVAPNTTCSAVTSDGAATVNQVAKFTTACNIENSAIFESGGNIGIGNTSPAGKLDVSGATFIRGSLAAYGGAVMEPSGTATASQAFISTPLDIEASVYNTSIGRAANYIYQWQAEPVGNDSAATSATLNLLYGVSGSLSETGISVNNNGIMTFASGQTFPGTGKGTVTSVATGSGLTGGPVTSSGTISIPSAGVTNAMLQNSSITVKAGTGLSGGGTVALGGTVTLTNTGGTGTVTSVGTGAGLTGGPITSSGTISVPNGGITNAMLANSGVTVQAGAGLSGGGTVALGSTVTLTGNLSGTTHGLAYFSNSSSVASTAAPANGQILVGSTGNIPVLATLTAGSNVAITNGPGSITVSATGTSASPLPLFVTGGSRTGAVQGPTENFTKVWGIVLPYSVNTTEVIYDVTTTDNTDNVYDLGIYTNSGTLAVNIGPRSGTTFSSAKGFHTLTWLQGTTSLAPGRYYLAMTTNCAATCAKIAATASWVSYAADASAGASQNGTLPSSITPPSDSWSSGIQPVVAIQ